MSFIYTNLAMKTPPSLILAAFIVGLLVTALSCSTSTVAPDSAPTGELRVSAPFAQQTTDFAFDFAKRVTVAEGATRNVFVSPLSLHIALGMVLNGANGPTAQEIQKTLKLDAQTLAEANQTYRNLLENLPAVDTKVQMGLANSVWYQNTFAVEKTFVDLLRETFKADIKAENFADAATPTRINTWVSEKTKGRIPKVLDQIRPDEVMFLINTVYFKGDWKTKFDADATADQLFTAADGTPKTVRMMRIKDAFRRATRANYEALELPYGADKFAMTVLLPNEGTTAEAVLNGLTSSEWAQLNSKLTSQLVTVGLPKFILKDLSYDLTGLLREMGMPTAFTDRADFSKLSAAERTYLTSVKQGTFVAVDEQGTEAAAATSVGVGVVSYNPDEFFDCNRPFVFVIHEKTSGTILFIGKVADPTKTKA